MRRARAARPGGVRVGVGVGVRGRVRVGVRVRIRVRIRGRVGVRVRVRVRVIGKRDLEAAHALARSVRAVPARRSA